MDYTSIKNARKKRGYSQADMARLLQVHKNTYVLWETGAGQPSPDNLRKLERVLETNAGAK